MKNGIIFLVLISLIGCKEKVADTYLTPEKVIRYFKEIEAACNRDNGKLWGKNLYGPLMIVDRSTRKIFSNCQDDEGLLKEKDGIYTGIYPSELVINNLATTYGGTLFAMAPLPAEEDEYRIISSSIHSLFHRFQETIGFISSGYNTTNMDEKNARLWIKLEWKALRKALNSTGDEQLLAIRDALVFRGSNREFYQKYASDETKFETYEGLARFTLILLSTNSPEENLKRLLEYLDRIYSVQSYSRSYGSVHGALYANLLYQKGFNFASITSENVDLGGIVKEVYNIQLPEVCRDVAGSLAFNYDIGTIQEEEATREAAIKESIHRQTSIFIEKPVVYLELESPYFDFEPEDIHAMDTLGTLYSRLRVSDNWGKLTVDKGGCLVSNNLRYLRITARGFKEVKNRFEGEGWHLILNYEWELVPVDQNFYVRRLVP
jgi:hypothetical protein